MVDAWDDPGAKDYFMFQFQGVHLKVASWSKEAVGMPAVTAASQVSGERMGGMSKGIKFLAKSVPLKQSF